MSTDAPFRRQIYQRGTLLIKKCVTKPNMHLNVLHTQVFISIEIHLSLYTHTHVHVLYVLWCGLAPTITALAVSVQTRMDS